MRVLGIDFTSAPRRRKPITCVDCELKDDLLIVRSLIEWADFDGFEGALQEPGPWIAGIDLPFGQASRFIETIGWPKCWADYVATHTVLDELISGRRSMVSYNATEG
ncbi:hypothetical protein [Sinorhizobium fredii]|uniref:hypothetical protein n=1 Tax=Rhizobium fredii TaxID=380 RepID=UPI0005B3E9A8|nr:hypothetical protein [Sinorhizobium fredii]